MMGRGIAIVITVCRRFGLCGDGERCSIKFGKSIETQPYETWHYCAWEMPTYPCVLYPWTWDCKDLLECLYL